MGDRLDHLGSIWYHSTNAEPSDILCFSELSLEGVLYHPRNWEDLLTLFQPEGADYVHHITASTPGFENLTTSLFLKQITSSELLFGSSVFLSGYSCANIYLL